MEATIVVEHWVLKQSLYYITIIHSRLKNNYICIYENGKGAPSNILNFLWNRFSVLKPLNIWYPIWNKFQIVWNYSMAGTFIMMRYLWVISVKKNEKTDIIKATIEMQVIINFEESQITSYIKDKLITEDVLGITKIAFSHNISHIQHLVDVMNSTYVCTGGPSVINYLGSY